MQYSLSFYWPDSSNLCSVINTSGKLKEGKGVEREGSLTFYKIIIEEVN